MCVLKKGLFCLLSWLSSFLEKLVEGYWHESTKQMHQLQVNYSQSHDYLAWSNHVGIFYALV
jgi:hypothetical protein